jgi:hypothetical protein
MPNETRRFVVSYVLLVGLPILAVVAILHLGRNLRAPARVAGTWGLDFSSSHSPIHACNPTARASHLVLTISQSGREISPQFNGSEELDRGTIEGTTLQWVIAPRPEWSGPSVCPGLDLSFVAQVDSETMPTFMRGIVFIRGCTACTSTEFRATRRPDLAGKNQ